MTNKKGNIFGDAACINMILFMIGFVAVSMQFIFMRQVAPYVGVSAIVVSIVLSIFLSALALGYDRGGKAEEGSDKKLKRNLWLSAFMLAAAPSYFVVTAFFGAWFSVTPDFGISFLNNPLVTLAAYLALFMFPLVYIIEQSIPLLMNSMRQDRAAKLAGKAFSISTWGNVAGGAFTTLVLMYYLGMAWTITLNALLLGTIALYLSYKSNKGVRGFIGFGLLSFLAISLNVGVESNQFVKTTAYANYEVKELHGVSYLVTNHNNSSALYPDGTGFLYMEKIKEIIFKRANKEASRDILLVGAGGFSATQQGVFGNNVTYVDIDPQIKDVAEQFFLHDAIKEKFVGVDARSYLVNNPNLLWDAIVIDAYTGMNNIPRTLVTREFFSLLYDRTKPGGKVVLNVLINPDYSDEFSRGLDYTIRSVFPGCLADSLGVYKGVTNVIYTCFKSGSVESRSVYTDDNTRHEIDSLILLTQNHQQDQ